MMKMAQEIARRVEHERSRADKLRAGGNVTSMVGGEKVRLAHSPAMGEEQPEEGPPPAYRS